jgi:hypothetical protein
MKTMLSTLSAALILALLSAPALAGRAGLTGAADPATPRAALMAANTANGDTVYGPGYTAPIHDGWG